ncbi:MAG: Gfo/Idh/MocA family oxidoreductase [Clostridiales bacterium]|nr:Gfo/Idh/MocA family oxidoreductase [Clostridiales bacterium]
MKRLAVIGIGRMGSRHARNLAKGVVKGGKLVAVCDVDKQVLDGFCAKYKVSGYEDYIQMLDKENLDGVIIATPHKSHIAIAKECVKRGIHTLLEKPISVTTKEAEEIVDVLKDNDKVIGAMMFNQRTNRMYAKAKALIAEGKIGKIQRVNFIVTDWYRTQFYYDMGGWRASWSGEGGGTLINQCVHQLDILQWLIGMPERISANCKTVGRNITTENDVTAVLSYKDFECVFTASTHEVPGTNRLEIAGDAGKIVIEKFKMYYWLNDFAESEINARAKRDYGNKQDKKSKKKSLSYGLTRMIYDGIYGQQSRIIKNFVKAMECGDKSVLLARMEEGINGLTLINAMNMSSWLNKPVDLPLDKDAYAEMLNQKIEEEKR